MKHKSLFFGSLLCLCLFLVACNADPSHNGKLTATGPISAESVSISTEIGGKVVEIAASKGQNIASGDKLFRLDDSLLNAQLDQAKAAADVASAAVDAANAQLANAETQYKLVFQNIRYQDRPARTNEWNMVQSDFDLPPWYFTKSEELITAEAEVNAANIALETEKLNLEKTLKDTSNEDFISAEKRLAEAQAAYKITNLALEQAKNANEGDTLVKAAQDKVDLAKADLDAARLQYDRLLNSTTADNVREARSRVAVAQARVDYAQDELARVQTGSQSLQVTAAMDAVNQAKAAVAQAEANHNQAQSAIKVIELQIEKLNVTAPVSGTILSTNIELGEIASPGSILMVIGKLNDVKLTVYIPEDQYGKVFLGQPVSVSVDSYPSKVFSGKVVYISDEAEFTPRNVSTVEGRKSTVYAIEINLSNPDQQLKPGMPADVTFTQ